MTVEIIAEIGCEHGGSVDEFKRLCDAVHATGQVQWIKWQCFITDDLVSKAADPAQHAKLSALEWAPQQHQEAKAHVEGLGLRPLVSVFSPSAVWTAHGLGFADLKVGSGDITDKELVRAATVAVHSVRSMDLGRPRAGWLFISTGMSEAENIADAGRWARAAGFLTPWAPIWLACTSCYPCEEASAHVSRIGWLQENVEGSVGYSDHTATSTAATLAVALGARFIEKHVTSGRGPDADMAMDLDAFESWCCDVRMAEAAMGGRRPHLLKCEEDTFRKARKSPYLVRNVKAGDPLTDDDFAMLRPWRETRARLSPMRV